MELSKYAQKHNVDERTVYRWIKSGKLITTKHQGKILILGDTSDFKKLDPKAEKVLIKSKRSHWDGLIGQAINNNTLTKKVINAISTELKKLSLMGITIHGYSEKSIYRKIKNPDKITRKTRSDRYSYKNKILRDLSVEKKLQGIASYFFMQDANASMRLVTHRIQEAAKKCEEYYELAAVPFNTLYDAVKKELSREKHQIRNHYDQFVKSKPYIQGAFTNDIDFMDWLSLDDHMIEIGGARIWNDLKGEYEIKSVYSWFLIEMKTMHIISYAIKPESFNAKDVQLLILHALMKVGRPNKGILMDNGLASSESCLSMLDRLRVPYKLGKPYHPKDKANNERIFGFIKNECISLIGNYTGGSRSEGRHRSLKLSPEPCNIYFNELKEIIAKYIYGRYRTRPRKRMVNRKKEEISIEDYYNREYMTYTPNMFPKEKLCEAFLTNITKKLVHNHIKLGKYGIYIASCAMPAAFNNHKYTVKYNPLDMSKVYLFATKDIIDKCSGMFINKGDFFTTLVALEPLPNEEKQALVNKVNKQYEKSLRAMGGSMYDKTAISLEHEGLTTTYEVEHLREMKKELREATDYKTRRKMKEAIDEVQKEVEKTDEEKKKELEELLKPGACEPDDVISKEEMDELDAIARGDD